MPLLVGSDPTFFRPLCPTGSLFVLECDQRMRVICDSLGHSDGESGRVSAFLGEFVKDNNKR